MTAKNTPGPWEVRPWSSKDDKPLPRMVDIYRPGAYGQTHLFPLLPTSLTSLGMEHFDKEITPEAAAAYRAEQMANAYLMAAAPILRGSLPRGAFLRQRRLP